MTTVAHIKYKYTSNVSDTARIVFRDKSVLHVNVPSGCDISNIFKPDVIIKWNDVYEINTEDMEE